MNWKNKHRKNEFMVFINIIEFSEFSKWDKLYVCTCFLSENWKICSNLNFFVHPSDTANIVIIIYSYEFFGEVYGVCSTVLSCFYTPLPLCIKNINYFSS